MPFAPSHSISKQPATLFRGRQLEWLFMGVLTALCLLLPTHNSTLDAWYYAACVRHSHELLLPHHLLHNVVGWLWVQVLPNSVDTLLALKALNALAFGGCLVALRSLLRWVGGVAAPVAGWLLVVGSSFGMLRFATENETYILPLLLSLLASRSWWRAVTGDSKHWLLAGMWAVGAALLHQIHAGWWLALLAGALAANGSKNWQKTLLYALPALLVPLAYIAALPSWSLPFTPAAFWRFVFHDLYAGQAGAPPSGHTLLLTGVNLARTFGQLHGSTLALLRRWPMLSGIGLLSAGLMGLAGFQLWRARQQVVVSESGRSAYLAQSGDEVAAKRLFWWVHASALLLQMGCALWAEGNAEFMVMVPALLALLLVNRSEMRAALLWAGASLLIWNLTFGLLPAHLLQLTHAASLLTRVQQEPTAWWLLADPNLVRNQLHYYTGQPVGPPNVLPAPALLVRRPGQSPARFRVWLAARRAAGQRVYTDALDGPSLLDRARITQGGPEAHRALLAGYHLARVDSFSTSFGPVYLTEIQ